MSENFYTYAQFDNCTPILSAKETKTFVLDWNLPENINYKYRKLEIYRYIGDLNTVVTIPTETDTHSELIYTATQEFDINSNYANGVTLELNYFNGNKEITTLSTMITAISSFSDDLNKYNNTNTILKTNHNISENVDDATIIEDILTTKRCLYYIMVTHINGIYDASPYCIGSHTKTGVLDNTSTKTQVRFDTLNLEGDIIWATKLTNPTPVLHTTRGISRTAVDLNSMYLDETGNAIKRGGYAWVADRLGHTIYRCNLKNGLQTANYNNQYQNNIRGHAITVDPDTGDCFAGSYDWGSGEVIDNPTSGLIRCKTDTLPISSDENISNQTTITVKANYPTSAVSFYGTTNIASNKERIGFCSQNTYGHLNTRTGDYSTYGYDAHIYSLASGPDGMLFLPQRGRAHSMIYLKQNYDPYIKVLSTVPSHEFRTISIDNYSLWPNIHNDKSKYHVLTVDEARFEPLYMLDLSINSTLPLTAIAENYKETIVYDNKLNNWNGDIFGIGVDGDNNAWGLGKYRAKIYRMRNISDYPVGAICRYPSIDISEQPTSYLNTPEIEWFLMRDSGYINPTYNLSSFGTMDNSLSASVDWLGDSNPKTAYQAWWGLVDNKRFELSPTTNCVPDTNDTKLPTGGFDVKRETNGSVTQYTKDYGIRLKNYDTNYAGCLTAIYAWYNAFINPDTAYTSLLSADRLNKIDGNLQGRRVHPWYTSSESAVMSSIPFYNNNTRIYNNNYKPGFALSDATSTTPSYTVIFQNWNGYSYEYSDFTGNILLGSRDSTPINKDIIHPDPDIITIQLNLSGSQSNGGYQEIYQYCYPWKIVTSNMNNISGYDDLTVTGNVILSGVTFDVNEIIFNTDDYTGQSYTIAKNDENPNVFNISHKYNDPSKIGLYYLPSGHNNNTEYLQNRKSGGVFIPSITISAIDIYNNTSFTTNASASITVLERWPEPRVYLDASDLSLLRTNMFSNSTWGIDRFDKTGDLRKESRSSDAKRWDTTYGVDPIRVELKDRSIARTYPISSWNITLSTNNARLSWYPTKTIELTSDVNLQVNSDTQNVYDSLTAFDFRYGEYKVIMNVAASTTSTSSDREFINYISVAEFEPFANFWATSAATVSSNFTCDTPTPISEITGTFPNGNNVNYPFVSGYAPLLTVYFQESSEAHTFPIGVYNWNFGDYYNEGSSNVQEISSNYYTVCTTQVSGDFNTPNWRTDVTAHTAVHTYTIPGTYDVTLTVTSSGTDTSDVCARYIGTDDVKRFYVYVAEILPIYIENSKASTSETSGFTDNFIFSGVSPQTYYFCGSGILAGSFPICKMMWDFGDGTLETITRTPSTQITTQGLPMVYHSDPRYTIVPHIFTNKVAEPLTYNIGVSAFVCNTNTMVATGTTGLIGPILNSYAEQDEKRRLIGSRFDDMGNLIYIFEGLTTKNTYTTILSGAI